MDALVVAVGTDDDIVYSKSTAMQVILLFYLRTNMIVAMCYTKIMKHINIWLLCINLVKYLKNVMFIKHFVSFSQTRVSTNIYFNIFFRIFFFMFCYISFLCYLSLHANLTSFVSNNQIYKCTLNVCALKNQYVKELK